MRKNYKIILSTDFTCKKIRPQIHLLITVYIIHSAFLGPNKRKKDITFQIIYTYFYKFKKSNKYNILN